MSALRFPEDRCPDCAVLPGQRHHDGCDVARCVGCGEQALQCDEHTDLTVHPMQRWTGRWPGDVEVEEGLATDLNDLYMRFFAGELRWNVDQERFVRA